MFTERDLADDVVDLRDELVPTLLVLDVEKEFEAMPAEWVYDLAIVTESIDPLSYPPDWVPADAPNALRRLTDSEPRIGLPGDGGVTWTAQTDPPLVFVKPRLAGAPADFVDFLVVEAIQQIALGQPEHALGFFAERYLDLQTAVGGDPELAFGLSVALTEGWRGLETRAEFRTWADSWPRLHEAWADAGNRLEERVSELPQLVADGTLGFVDATELACSAIKHDLELPPPFAALDVAAYREQGAAFAVRWAAETVSGEDTVPGG